MISTWTSRKNQKKQNSETSNVWHFAYMYVQRICVHRVTENIMLVLVSVSSGLWSSQRTAHCVPQVHLLDSPVLIWYTVHTSGHIWHTSSTQWSIAGLIPVASPVYIWCTSSVHYTSPVYIQCNPQCISSLESSVQCISSVPPVYIWCVVVYDAHPSEHTTLCTVYIWCTSSVQYTNPVYSVHPV